MYSFLSNEVTPVANKWSTQTLFSSGFLPVALLLIHQQSLCLHVLIQNLSHDSSQELTNNEYAGNRELLAWVTFAVSCFKNVLPLTLFLGRFLNEHGLAGLFAM